MMMRSLLFPSLAAVFTVLLMLFLPTRTMQAVPRATIVVTDTGQDDPADPNADSNGTCTLSEAIRAANTDSAVDACPAGSGADTIQLGANTYSLEYVEQTFDGPNAMEAVQSDILIQGAGTASTTIERASGAADPFRLFNVRSTAVLQMDELTVRGGELESFEGGAIYNAGGVISMTNVLLTDNSAPRGGALANSNGTVFIAESSLTDNSAILTDTNDGLGGAIYSGGGRLILVGSTLATNTANADGGAIYNWNGSTLTATLINLTLNIANADVTGGGRGGGLYTESDSYMIGGNVTENLALPTLGGADATDGGGIWSSGDLSITGTLLTLNGATNGGGLYQVTGETTLDYTIVTDNGALEEGGGIFNDGTMTLLHSNVTLNGAVEDGGGILTSRNLIVRDSTISFNASANGSGGGLVVRDESGFDLEMVNSTLSDNQASNGDGRRPVDRRAGPRIQQHHR